MKPSVNMLSQIVSDLAMTHALLNCVLKEFALPNRKAHYQWPDKLDGLNPDNCLSGVNLKAIPMLVSLADHKQLFVLVDRQSPLGSQRYLSDVYIRADNQPWSNLPFQQLATFVLEACSCQTQTDNQELYEQINSSRELVAHILAHHGENSVDQPFSSYIASEQSLWFGHPSHPAPKARLWPDFIPQEEVTPEFGACTQLYQFEVPAEGLCIKANGLSDLEVLSAVAPQTSHKQRAVIAMHPVQAELVKNDARFQQLVENEVIRDLGPSGYSAAPTASIRTWYLDEMPYFVKGSLNVRITNCVRKNAWYELESTLIIDTLFRRLMADSPSAFRGALIASEPAVLSWVPTGANEEDKIWFTEQTSVILRENFCTSHPDTQFALAATAFARDNDMRPMIWSLIGSDASTEQRLSWFRAYQKLLLQPVLSLFFDYGIVTEPHLQNTVFGHDNGMPTDLLLRDYEGIKLTQELGIKHVDEPLDPKVKESLVYSREKGWQRISYCLFINNLSEAILALSWDRPELANIMWDVVKHELIDIKASLSKPAPELDTMIATGGIACKCNLKVRLAGHADKQVQYTQLTAPWSKEVVCA